jgi:hypothetical protein
VEGNLLCGREFQDLDDLRAVTPDEVWTHPAPISGPT